MFDSTTQFLMEVKYDVDVWNSFEHKATLTVRLAKFF